MSESTPTAEHVQLRDELANLMREIVRADPVEPGEVDDDTPCVGGSLLQDSLDVLEFAVAVEREFGVAFRDPEVGRTVMTDMGTLTRHVAERRD